MAKDYELSRRVTELEHRIRSLERSGGSVIDLETRVQRLERTCRALWGLLRDRGELSEEALLLAVEAMGEPETHRECSACGRTNAARARACMYCGAEISIRSAFDLL